MDTEFWVMLIVLVTLLLTHRVDQRKKVKYESRIGRTKTLIGGRDKDELDRGQGEIDIYAEL